MKKNLLLLGALVGTFLLGSCAGGNKKQAEPVSAAELENAGQVMRYYNLSTHVLGEMVNEKDINAVLGYMEQEGKAPAVSPIAPPPVSAKDTAELMYPDLYFTVDVSQNLKENYVGLFQARQQFFANFDSFLSAVKAKNKSKIGDLLNTNNDLSIKMSECKMNIIDILSPHVVEAEHILLKDNPLKDQMIAVHKISRTMQSVLNLYARKHIADGVRLDLKMEELSQEVDAAEKIPAVTGYEKEMKSFKDFLSSAQAFLKDVQKVRAKGAYNEEDYNMLVSEYGVGII